MFKADLYSANYFLLGMGLDCNLQSKEETACLIEICLIEICGFLTE